MPITVVPAASLYQVIVPAPLPVAESISGSFAQSGVITSGAIVLRGEIVSVVTIILSHPAEEVKVSP